MTQRLDHPSRAEVYAAVQRRQPATATEIAAEVCGSEAWRHRTNVRNRLDELARAGAIIGDEGRPVRFADNELRREFGASVLRGPGLPRYPEQLVEVVLGLRAAVNRGSIVAGAAVEIAAEEYGTTRLAEALYHAGVRTSGGVQDLVRRQVREFYDDAAALDENARRVAAGLGRFIETGPDPALDRFASSSDEVSVTEREETR